MQEDRVIDFDELKTQQKMGLKAVGYSMEDLKVDKAYALQSQ